MCLSFGVRFGANDAFYKGLYDVKYASAYYEGTLVVQVKSEPGCSTAPSGERNSYIPHLTDGFAPAPQSDRALCCYVSSDPFLMKLLPTYVAVDTLFKRNGYQLEDLLSQSRADKPYYNLPFVKDELCSSAVQKVSNTYDNKYQWFLTDLVDFKNLGNYHCCDTLNCTANMDKFLTSRS